MRSRSPSLELGVSIVTQSSFQISGYCVLANDRGIRMGHASTKNGERGAQSTELDETRRACT